MTTDMPEKVKALVWNPDNMDRETFCLHMTHRHGDSLGGMKSLDPDVQTEYTEELWRTFHAKLHGPLLRREYDHEHEQ